MRQLRRPTQSAGCIDDRADGDGWRLGIRRSSAARPKGRLSDFLRFSAPAGNRPATTDTVIDGVRAAILPNGRLVTPAGTEVNVQAPKPFGLALSPDGRTLATLNSGAGPFSLTLITRITQRRAAVKRIDLNASFMGVTFSPDSRRVYLSGGENGNIWIGDAAAGQIIGSVNLNGADAPARSAARRGGDAAAALQGRVPGQHGADQRRTLSLRRRPGQLPGSRDRRRQDQDRARRAGTHHGAGQLRRRHRSRQSRPLSVRHRAVAGRPHAAGHPRRRVPVHAPPAGEPDRQRQSSTTRSAIPARVIPTRRDTIA